MNGQAELVIMSAIVNEEEKCEGEIAIAITDNVTVEIALLALANLLANVVNNVAKSADEKAQMLDYIINTAIGIMYNESLN